MNKNNFDPSPEADSERGPVDLKLSRGMDKTVVEVKLSSNGQYLHGYQMQLKEYGKAEHTENQIYVFVDVGNPGRLKTILEADRVNRANGISCPGLIIVDAQEKAAASTYTEDNVDLNAFDFDFGDMPELDFLAMQDLLSKVDFPEFENENGGNEP